MIGAQGDDDNGNGSGSSYVFHFDGTKWIEQAKVTASDGSGETTSAAPFPLTVT